MGERSELHLRGSGPERPVAAGDRSGQQLPEGGGYRRLSASAVTTNVCTGDAGPRRR
jgi:hypothetical protein